MTSAMVLPLPTSGSEAAWTSRVRAAVRPEYSDARLVVDVNDPAYSAGPCRIPGCQRLARGHGLCAGHHQRWAKTGRPDLDEFAATTDPGWARQRPNRACRVQECGYGVARAGLCQLHAQRWERSGRSDVQQWLAEGPPPVKAPVADTCQVPGCPLWPQAAGPFCHAHHATWRANRRPDPEVFAHAFAAVAVPSDQVIDLARLPGPLRWELAYVIQSRHDERASRTPPEVVARVMSFLLEAGVTSLREGDEQAWREAFTASGRRDSNGRGLLVYAHQRVADLAAGGGWDSEYPREVWQLRRLGYPGNLTLDFTRIDQPWLRELAKRWTRQRMATGVGLEAVRRGLTALTRLGGYLQRARIDGPQQLTRVVLERYLADLAAGIPTAHQRQVHIGQLRGFLEAVRQRGWAPLDPTAALFTDDNPPRPERGPRAVPEQVMAQIESLLEAGVPTLLTMVLTAQNAGDLAAVIDFCRERGLALEVNPVSVPDNHPLSLLAMNPRRSARPSPVQSETQRTSWDVPLTMRRYADICAPVELPLCVVVGRRTAAYSSIRAEK